jgi:hypothetical protein
MQIVIDKISYDKPVCSRCVHVKINDDISYCGHIMLIMNKITNYVTGEITGILPKCHTYNSKGQCELFSRITLGR